MNQLIILVTCFSSQDGFLCTPEGRDCIERNSEKTGGCGVSCEGIYADVEHRLLDEAHVQNPLFDEVVERYREYKRRYVKNIGFNAAAFSTIFGEFQFCCLDTYLALKTTLKVSLITI